MNTQEYVNEINKKGCKTVLAFAGGGAEALSELTRFGGGSNTLLSAICAYCPEDFREFVGYPKLTKFVDKNAATMLGMAAYQRARKLTGSDDVVGIGSTSKLAKAADQTERAERTHEIHIAAQTQSRTTIWSYNLDRTINRSRMEEEHINALAVLNSIGVSSHLGKLLDLPISNKESSVEMFFASSEVSDVICGKMRYALIKTDKGELLHPKVFGELIDDSITFVPTSGDDRPKAILCGSFRPVHHNHVAMRKITEEIVGGPCYYEISSLNYEKPVIDYADLYQRLKSIESQDEDAKVLLTRHPLFADKTELFIGKEITFAMGFDTFERIANDYNLSSHVREFADHKVKFLVFHRKDSEGNLSTERQIKPNTVSKHCLLGMTEFVSVDRFLDDGTSSTQIRNKAND